MVDEADVRSAHVLALKETCPHCGAYVESGAQFCGSCGNRIRGHGPLRADNTRDKKPEDVATDVDAADVSSPSMWPEVYDVESGGWVAVDLMFDFVARDPVVEWMHRGTPMLWMCAADDGLQGGNHCILRDVTSRYSPSWWRVQQARGPKRLQKWWEEALEALSSLPGDVRLSSGDAAASALAAASYMKSIAAEADRRDVDKLQAKRLSDAMPTTKAALKGHHKYVLKSDLRVTEVCDKARRWWHLWLAALCTSGQTFAKRALSSTGDASVGS